MSRTITVCEKSSPSCGLNRREQWAMISRMTCKFSRKTFSGCRLSGGGGVSIGTSTENPLSGSGIGEDSIGIEGREGPKPLREKRLEAPGRRSRLRDVGTLRSSSATRVGVIAPEQSPPSPTFLRRGSLRKRYVGKGKGHQGESENFDS